MIQSGYNFAHVTTAQLSWHVQNCDLIGSLESELKQKRFSQNLNYEFITVYEMALGWQVVSIGHVNWLGSHPNLICAKVLWGIIKSYLHFLLFLDPEMILVVEIISHWRQGPVYPILSQSHGCWWPGADLVPLDYSTVNTKRVNLSFGANHSGQMNSISWILMNHDVPDDGPIDFGTLLYGDRENLTKLTQIYPYLRLILPSWESSMHSGALLEMVFLERVPLYLGFIWREPNITVYCIYSPGPWFNIKMSSYQHDQYRKSHLATVLSPQWNFLHW